MRAVLVVQNDVEQRTMDLQSAFRAAGIVNEAQLPESVHEEADTRSSGPNHFGQSLLTNLRDNGFWNTVLAKVCEQQQDARQPLLTGVEQLVDKILFVTDIPRQQVHNERDRKRNEDAPSRIFLGVTVGIQESKLGTDWRPYADQMSGVTTPSYQSSGGSDTPQIFPGLSRAIPQCSGC